MVKSRTPILVQAVQLVALASLSIEAIAADIRPYISGTYRTIVIEGPIKPGDFETFIKIIRENQSQISSVTLYSPGGNFYEAMKIGRALRTFRLHSQAPMLDPSGHPVCDDSFTKPNDKKNCTCASACFFIHIGATHKGGTFLAVHRPYFAKGEFGNLSEEEAKKAFDALQDSARRPISSAKKRSRAPLFSAKRALASLRYLTTASFLRATMRLRRSLREIGSSGRRDTFNPSSRLTITTMRAERLAHPSIRPGWGCSQRPSAGPQGGSPKASGAGRGFLGYRRRIETPSADLRPADPGRRRSNSRDAVGSPLAPRRRSLPPRSGASEALRSWPRAGEARPSQSRPLVARWPSQWTCSAITSTTRRQGSIVPLQALHVRAQPSLTNRRCGLVPSRVRCRVSCRYGYCLTA